MFCIIQGKEIKILEQLKKKIEEKKYYDTGHVERSVHKQMQRTTNSTCRCAIKGDNRSY